MTQAHVFVSSHQTGQPIGLARTGFDCWRAMLFRADIPHSAHLTIGAWAGGREPSIYTIAHGEQSDIVGITRQFASINRQECAIVCDLSGSSARLAQFRFDALLDVPRLVAIDELLWDLLDGWTWATIARQSVLLIAHVPVWSNELPSVFETDIRHLRDILIDVGEACQVTIADCDSIVID